MSPRRGAAAATPPPNEPGPAAAVVDGGPQQDQQGSRPPEAAGPPGGRGDVVAQSLLAGGLPDVPEPVDVRDRWWAAERAGDDRTDLVVSVADVVWAAWGAHLTDAGQAWLAEVTASYRRELWLWLAGERPWEQALAGLAGRVYRRVPS